MLFKFQLGFGKSMPTNCVWLDNLSESVTEKFLCQQFGRYGEVSHAVIDRCKGRALIYFTSMDTAQYAVNEMRNRILKKKRVQVIVFETFFLFCHSLFISLHPPLKKSSFI